MKSSAKSRRRWFGAICLIGALILLLAGPMQPNARLNGWLFISYWLLCFVLTFLAMIAALRDAFALRHESRESQRALIESTIQEIQAGRDKARHEDSPP